MIHDHKDLAGSQQENDTTNKGNPDIPKKHKKYKY